METAGLVMPEWTPRLSGRVLQRLGTQAAPVSPNSSAMHRLRNARLLRRVLVVLGLLIMLTWLWNAVSGGRPARLHGPLAELPSCPPSPNCVCSQSDPADAQHAIAPLRYTGDPAAALARLQAVIEALPRTRIVTAGDHYLHAECTSRLLRFVDDLECLVDPEASVIHLRSASRVGHSDLGVNRQRVETIRARFAAN